MIIYTLIEIYQTFVTFTENPNYAILIVKEDPFHHA
jgi:hypothetical protein